MMDNIDRTDPYSYWKAALAGKKPKMFVDDPQCGFFRRGIYTRDTKGNNRRTGWAPVAIFIDRDSSKLNAVMHNNTLVTDRDNINELWSYCCANPISEETYRDVAENYGAWPDAPQPLDALERIIGPAHNDPPEVLTDV